MVGGGPGSLHRVPTGRSGWLLLLGAVRDPASSGAAPGGSTCHLSPRKDVPVTSGRWETILDWGNHGLLPHRRARPGHVCSCTASGMCRRHKARLLCRRTVASFPGPLPSKGKSSVGDTRITRLWKGFGTFILRRHCRKGAVPSRSTSFGYHLRLLSHIRPLLPSSAQKLQEAASLRLRSCSVLQPALPALGPCD